MTYITLFCCDRWYYPHFVDLQVPWIWSSFRGYLGYIRISWIFCMCHIKSYLSCNVRPIFHIYSYSASKWCITYFPVCILIYFIFPLPFALFVLWVSINWILTLSRYMCLLLSLQSDLFLFSLIFSICVLYWRVV